MTWASGGSVKGVPDNANPAQIVNLSLGGVGICPSYYQKVIDDMVDRGSIVVAAAGNEDQDVSIVSPGGCDNVITVGAPTRTAPAPTTPTTAPRSRCRPPAATPK